jgi:hypothetical protein
MRDDMAKVVTERPRRGHGNKSKKTSGTLIRHYDPDANLLSPLKRYLRSCVGRPWRKVHSELSRTLDRRSVTGSHIWDHLVMDPPAFPD